MERFIENSLVEKSIEIEQVSGQLAKASNSRTFSCFLTNSRQRDRSFLARSALSRDIFVT
ncbi:MAG: hypothetical protein Q8R06_10555 [Polaromonas sp.]|uniref:hypothetical protein n=1 Tax=Polaromonas sp. TaxID=1869339 RepID=UPI002734785A|nr:hypothetical protein [Polaromonas sp.]MDP3797574.1 hypothetical protein [Polaromonas sp.]